MNNMMYEEEEEVIHLDYNSNDEYSIPDDNYESEEEESITDQGENEAEARLMEYLLKGLVLQSTTCPVKNCNTPLVKSLVVDTSFPPISSDSKIEPIAHVPYCASCSAHVVTNDEDLQVLQKAEYKAVLDIEGAVIYSFGKDGGKAPSRRMTPTTENDSDYEERPVSYSESDGEEEEHNDLRESEDIIEDEEEEEYVEEEEEEVENIHDPYPMTKTVSSFDPIATNLPMKKPRRLRASMASVEELNYDLIDYEKR